MRSHAIGVLVGLAGLAAIAGADVAVYNGVVLGETASLETRWGSIYGIAGRAPVAGDTFGARALVQDGASAFFIDDVPDTHLFGAVEAAGVNFLGNLGDSFSIASAVTDLGGGQELVQVEMTNLNASGAPSMWHPTPGLLSPNGVPYNSWRLDVGSTAAGTDDIAWDPALFAVVSSGFTAFDSTGASLGTFALTLDTSTATGLSGVGVIGIGGGDIGGFDLASIQLFWEVKKVPAPGSLGVIGLGALFAVRRRR